MIFLGQCIVPSRGHLLSMQKSTDCKGKQSKGVNGEMHGASVICDQPAASLYLKIKLLDDGNCWCLAAWFAFSSSLLYTTVPCKLKYCCPYFPKGEKGNEDGGGRRKAVKRALFIDTRRTEHLGQCGGKCNAPGMIEIGCRKGRVRKKFMGR